jgi:hypothetical protein
MIGLHIRPEKFQSPAFVRGFVALLFGALLVVNLACTEREELEKIKENDGNIWMSGGLAQCAQQIRLDNGEILVENSGRLLPFISGDKVRVKYREMGQNQFCPPAIDIEVLEILAVE